MKWITAKKLGEWGKSIDVRIRLSELIAELVRASAEGITNFRFPTGDSAQIKGFDGRLVATGSPPFVPAGESVWEFGSKQNYLKKADEDYDSRTKAPLGVEKKTTTFVVVTPHTWDRTDPTKQEWINEKKALGVWGDVQVLDGVDLEEWLYRNPAVASRFAREIMDILPALGVQSTDDYWEDYSKRFKPTLTESVITCDRSAQVETVQRSFRGDAGTLHLSADSPDEATAFAVAAIRAIEKDERKFLESRTLILDTADAVKQLASRSGMKFIARASASSNAGRLVEKNFVMVPLGREDIQKGNAAALTRPSRYAMAQALETMGFLPNDANQCARACGRSVTILSRRIPSTHAPRPTWADPSTAAALIPALLAGAWDSSRESDQEIVSTLAGMNNYADYEAALHRFLRQDDSPIEREGTIWKMRAPVDAFVNLGPMIARRDSERLAKVVKAVFGEIDPALDLPVGERPYANLRGVVAKYSPWIREGLATTLLHVAVLYEEANLQLFGDSPQVFVNKLAESFPSLESDWRLLASIRDQLPNLMEAAPLPFLAALGRMLEGDGAVIRPLFEEFGMLGPSSYHTALLWGLERLAWDPAFLSKVSTILARMVRLDPGGKLNNRPINSLSQIYQPWHPSTNATAAQRILVLDVLIKLFPDVAWTLLTKLMPSGRGIAFPTDKLRLREATAGDPPEILTYELIVDTYRQVIDRALSLVGSDPERWKKTISRVHQFDAQSYERTLMQLRATFEGDYGEDRNAVWTTLLGELNRHREFADAEWAIKGKPFELLVSVVNSLEPKDFVARNRWLFDNQWPTMSKSEGVDGQDAAESSRLNATRILFDERGIQGVLVFAETVKFQYLVAQAFVDISPIGVLLDGLKLAIARGAQLENFSAVLIAHAAQRFGREWIKAVSVFLEEENLSPSTLGSLLRCLDDTPENWTFVDGFGEEVASVFWQKKPGLYIRTENVDVLVNAAQKYLEQGRALAAIDSISTNNNLLPTKIIFQLLDAAVAEVNKRGEQAGNISTYGIEQLFKVLASRPDVPLSDIARREYSYLPLLSHREKSLTLHKLMAEDPTFFVSILNDVFRPAEGEERESTPEGRLRAEFGYRLLSSFKLMPGQRNGELDVDMLRKWANGVRDIATNEDRRDIGEQYVGHVLAHAGEDAVDKAWPHRGVREIIEEMASEQAERGIAIERFNMRGVYSQAPGEGGKQERAFAENYDRWAATTQGWPRTSALLERIAEQWRSEGEREDQRAREWRLNDD